MRFCDAHCHTNAYTNPKDLTQYCKNNKIEIISVSNDIESYKYCKRRGIQNLAIGIHPSNVLKITATDLEFIRDEIKRGNCFLIGEIGLDYSPRNRRFKDRQKEIFNKVLTIAEEYGISVNIHSYRAVKDVLEILDSYENFRVLLHWFTGSPTELKNAIDKGYFLGITPSIFKSKTVQNIVLNAPIGNILTESDSPINKWTPLHIPKVVEKIAEIKGLPMDIVSNRIYKNFINYSRGK